MGGPSFDLMSFWTILLYMSKGKPEKLGQNSLGFGFCPKDLLKWYKKYLQCSLGHFYIFSLGPYPSPWHGGTVVAIRAWGSLDHAQPLGRRVTSGNLHLPALGPGWGSVDSFCCGFPRNDCAWAAGMTARCVAGCSPIVAVHIHGTHVVLPTKIS